MKLGMRVLILIGWMAGSIASNAAAPEKLELPADNLLRLCSEEFQTREKAQNEILKWARQNGEPAVSALIELSSKSENPEVRSRCLTVVREIAMEEFSNQGEGYIGINMLDVFVAVPGDPIQRAGIRVGQVVDDSAAAAAGILAGDVIVGLGDEVWREIPITEKFGKQIRTLKPKTKVSLKILRGDKVLEIEVILRRRPPIPANPFLLEESQSDIEALSMAEQESFFRNWLRERLLKK